MTVVRKYGAFGDFYWQECKIFMSECRRTYRYMNLEGSRDILTCRNTPASTELEPRERLARSPPFLSLSLPCASFTHTAPRGRLNPSVRIDHWGAAESRSATLGASLFGERGGGGYPEEYYFCLNSAPRNPATSPERIQYSTTKKKKNPGSKKYPSYLQPSCLTIPVLLLQRSQAPQLRPYLRGISTPCTGHFILPSAALERKEKKGEQ